MYLNAFKKNRITASVKKLRGRHVINCFSLKSNLPNMMAVTHPKSNFPHVYFSESVKIYLCPKWAYASPLLKAILIFEDAFHPIRSITLYIHALEMFFSSTNTRSSFKLLVIRSSLYRNSQLVDTNQK